MAKNEAYKHTYRHRLTQMDINPHTQTLCNKQTHIHTHTNLDDSSGPRHQSASPTHNLSGLDALSEIEGGRGCDYIFMVRNSI